MLNCVILKRNWIWDVLELDWKDISVILQGNNINLPTSVILPLRDKFRIRQLVRERALALVCNAEAR